MAIDPDDYRVRGSSGVHRPSSAAGACTIVEHLIIETDASSTFTIDVPAGVTLHVWAWWQVPINTDFFMTIEIDGVSVGSSINAVNADFDSKWPAAMSASKAGLSAGSHTIKLESDGIGDPSPGGITIWYVPDDCFRTQTNMGT